MHQPSQNEKARYYKAWHELTLESLQIIEEALREIQEELIEYGDVRAQVWEQNLPRSEQVMVGICNPFYNNITSILQERYEGIRQFYNNNITHIPREYYDGIQPFDKMDVRCWLVSQWPKFSGDVVYPIPYSEEGESVCESWAYDNLPKWDVTTQYGRDRRELLQFMINTTKNRIQYLSQG